MAIYKVDITQPLLKLEYIFKEYNIPVDLALFYKSNNIKEVYFSSKELTEDGYESNNRLVEYSCLDENNKICGFWNTINSYDNEFFDKNWWINNDLYPKYYFDDNIEDDFYLESQKLELPVVLELDPILEKISKYGRNSLTVEEFEYLHNF